ncbi:MAG: beta-N-acetylhexosaminidase [Nitrospiraceae bacterium]|nr:beta-N-acetylhexosaminidase [Nitrospiraceae bacterium]|tara:strand:+ start:13387 stop:14487 length:1101 start_codon:yes stop_codon:yes gene_type:complete
MNLKEKIGQLFILGFHGTTVSADLAHMLSSHKPGGVILFARNLADPIQVATLANELQSHSPATPLWISIDHEGGTVFRFQNGLTPLPASGELGRHNSEELVTSVASVGACELSAIGVNVNYAPVLDLNTNPDNPVIGERSFGADPEKVSRLGLAIIMAYHEQRIMACGKHFPGHGDTDADSHHELPVVSLSAERLRERECRPFHTLITKGLPAIMTAHVQYPQLDKHYPASLSRLIQTGLLREQLRFNGLIFSDDLEMSAIIDHTDICEAAIIAIEAGTDHLLICHDDKRQTAAMNAVYKAVTDGRIAMSRIDASFNRIIHYKKQYAFPHVPTDPATVKKLVGIAAHRHIVDRVYTTASASSLYSA